MTLQAFAEYQPRWIAFAAAHALTPAEAHQTPIPMWKFMEWIAAEWAAWFAMTGRPVPYVYSDADHAGFDAYLATRYPEVQR